MPLSVCLVTRNEEKNIERALRSVSAIANEMIVVDTGSTDRTAEMAAQAGAKVMKFEWQDDFAAAQNCALENAHGDWILFLNPDEELLSADPTVLRDLLTRDSTFGYALFVQDMLKAGREDSITETNQLRLFQRNASVRYRGRLHATLNISPDDPARAPGKLVSTSGLIIRRHAYLSVLTPEKLRWTAKLLELELRDRPGQIHYLIEYGRTLLKLNDPRGHDVLGEAVESLRPHLDEPVPPNPTVGSLVEYLLTVSKEQSRSNISLPEARELAIRWFPKTPPVVWALAQNLFQAAAFAEAAVQLESLLRMGATGDYDHSLGFDPDIMRAPALMNFGISNLRIGNLDKAQNCFGALLSDPVYGEPAAGNYAMVEKLRSQNSSEQKTKNEGK